MDDFSETRFEALGAGHFDPNVREEAATEASEAFFRTLRRAGGGQDRLEAPGPEGHPAPGLHLILESMKSFKFI